MSTFFFILMIIAMLGVLGALGTGLVFMTKPGDENRAKSNKCMQIRVYIQGFAILMFALAALTHK
jgi:hypothetical protein